jgi:hypothetical protein
MSTQSPDERATSRTEARRRARMAARGELPAEDLSNEAGEPQPEKRGFLQRLFPPAPPLPNRPDPLAGFDPEPPLRPIRERLFLLRKNLVAWLGFGLLAFLGFYASFFYAANLLGFIGTFLLFGALIAAGWFGWQRPTLYGTAAALVSFIVAGALIMFSFSRLGAEPGAFGSPGQVATQLGLQALYQAGLGFLGGWYGGYLRRRQTQLSSDNRRRR